MKIGVIGASGKGGGVIAKEAASRGHDVTAIVRSAGKVADAGRALISALQTAPDTRLIVVGGAGRASTWTKRRLFASSIRRTSRQR